MDAKKGRPSEGRPDDNQLEQFTIYPLWVQEKLAESGISLDDAQEAGIRFISSEECARFLGKDPRKNPVPDAIWIPYFDINGGPIMDNGQPYGRIRFRPGSEPEWTDDKGKVHRQRYAQRPGSSPHVYIPPGIRGSLKHFRVLADTEGEFKAISATRAGVPTVGMGGIQSWPNPDTRFLGKEIAAAHGNPVPELDHESPVHPELLDVIEAAKTAGIRRFLVLGDSDGRVERDKAGVVLSGNPVVEAAVRKLSKAIQWQVGDVEVFRGFCPFPENPDGKQGLDDWIVADGLMTVKTAILKMCGKWNRAISFQEKDHLAFAKWFRQRYQVDRTPGLVRWRENFFRWTGERWEVVEDKALQADLHEWLDTVPIFAGDRSVPPTRSLVESVWATLERLCHLPTSLDAPFRMSDPPAPIGSGKFLVLKNGVLNIEARELFPPSIELFAPNVLPFNYDPEAACPEWTRFLKTLWPDNPKSERLLRQWFGYLISGDTSRQKIFFMIGPKRSGRGTILRTLTELMGAENVTSFTLSGLGGDFGLQPLSGKSLAYCPDARLTGVTDLGPIVERLLSISGEDHLLVNRKYKDQISVRIPARIILVSNETPRLSDASGALVSRLVILRMMESFYGREDHHLTDRLKKEISGIFNWALAGLDDLAASGRFIEPEDSENIREDAERLASPVLGFIRDCCLTGAAYQVTKSALFSAWKNWCEEHGHHPGSDAMFSRNLKAAAPVDDYRPDSMGDDGKRPTCWKGIGLAVSYPDDSHEEWLMSRTVRLRQPADSTENGLRQGPSAMSGNFGKVSNEWEEVKERDTYKENNRENRLTCLTDGNCSQLHPDGHPDGVIPELFSDDSDIPVEDI